MRGNPEGALPSSRSPAGAPKWLVPLVALTAVVVMGCGDGSAPQDPDRFAAESWAVTGPSVRIGSVDDSAFAFGYVNRLAEAPDGHLFSLHFRETLVRRWTPQGEPDGHFGGEGEGPGEFIQPQALGLFGDSVWVMDQRAYRVSYFDLAGRFLGSVTPRLNMSTDPDRPYVSAPRPERPLRDGSFYGRSPAWSDAIARGQLTETPHVHMDSAGGVVATAWIEPVRSTDILALLRDTGGTFSQQRFGDATLSALGPDGTLVIVDRRVHEGAEPASFSVTKVTMAGDTTFGTEISYQPTVLDAARLDSAITSNAEQLYEFMSRQDPGLSVAKLEHDLREATFAPRHLPPIRRLVVAETGAIWLQRFDATPAGVEWLVLGSAGNPLAEVVTPQGLRVLLIGDDHLWGVETDELDVNYIVRYELQRGGG